jgi:protein-S-isoprenylcysteine O-methyltransferase Ste14
MAEIAALAAFRTLLLINLSLFALTARGFGFKIVHPSSRGFRQVQLIFAFAALMSIWKAFTAPIQRNGHIAGIAILMLSCVLFNWAVRTNRKQPLSLAFSSDLPARLVVDGPYGYVRHPVYTAYLLTFAAPLITFLDPVLIASFLAPLFIYVRAARHEEGKFNQGDLGELYVRYQSQTGMFLPRIRSIVFRRKS